MNPSVVLKQFQEQRARQDSEWQEVLTALQQLDPKCQVAVQRALLEELDCALAWRIAPRVPVSALRV